MVTLQDIAKIANVSKSTVSRYLNNGSVSQKTREKLDAIVKETGFQPNRLAQSLKSAKSNMAGVIIPRYDSPSTNMVMKGIDSLAYQKRVQLMITNSDLDIERTKENLRLLIRQKVGVIILFATEFDDELKQLIYQSDIPILVIGQQLANCPSFIFDDYEAGRIIGEHAVSLGHKELLFVGVNEADYAVGVLRKQGFSDAVEEAGAAMTFIETDFSRSINYQRALDYLEVISATYIAAATDHMAIGISNACMEKGIKIPDDLSLSGFGGYSVTQNVYPHITTVAYPFTELGERVMKKAIEILNDKSFDKDEITQLPVKLNIKGSTQSF